MKFDVKQKVLVAIYTEYQKDIPNMDDNIKADILGVTYEEFKIAIDKLLNEEMIKGANFSRGKGGIPLVLFFTNLRMTSKGIDYVEEKLLLDKTLTGDEKIKKLAVDSANWGWEQFKDIASKTLAEILKSNS
jgi:hypothetical protein